MRSKMSPERKAAEKFKDAKRKYFYNANIAEIFPEDHALRKSRHAQKERERRAAKPEEIRKIERLNNRMRMRAERNGKQEYDYVDLKKIQASTTNLEDNQNTPKRRYRRSPETRKIHAAQERKRMASLSPNAAAKARELKAKRERERRAAKSDAQRKIDRQKNAARMKDKRAKSNADHAVESVRQNFTINWKYDWKSARQVKWDYYTIINDKEYLQCQLHGLIIKERTTPKFPTSFFCINC